MMQLFGAVDAILGNVTLFRETRYLQITYKSFKNSCIETINSCIPALTPQPHFQETTGCDNQVSRPPTPQPRYQVVLSPSPSPSPSPLNSFRTDAKKPAKSFDWTGR